MSTEDERDDSIEAWDERFENDEPPQSEEEARYHEEELNKLGYPEDDFWGEDTHPDDRTFPFKD